MNFIQFVVPLIGGYWFLWKWNYTKFVVIEDNGYQLFFKSSIVGVIFLAFANSLVFAADFFNNGKIYSLRLIYLNPQSLHFVRLGAFRSPTVHVISSA